jgi:hypothetical protein
MWIRGTGSVYLVDGVRSNIGFFVANSADAKGEK